MANVVLQTEIPGTNATHGKVRDIYDLGDSLIFVASDRISAFEGLSVSEGRLNINKALQTN